MIELRDASKSGSLYVATSGQPYPVEIVKRGAETGRISFSRWNEHVSLSAPAGAIELGQLQHAPRTLTMALDQTKMGQVVAEQMEALESRFDDDCEIGDVCTIVEVIGPHGSSVSVRSSEARPHTTIGLLRMAEAMMLRSIGGRDLGDEEE